VLDRLIDVARTRGANRIWLETNSVLEAATALYEKKGFVALSGDENWDTPYLRCNLQMTMSL
jgi:GNAT superfamily N-acetyltransferase